MVESRELQHRTTTVGDVFGAIDSDDGAGTDRTCGQTILYREARGVALRCTEESAVNTTAPDEPC